MIVFLFVFIPKRVIGLSEGYFDGNDNRDKDGTALGLILGCKVGNTDGCKDGELRAVMTDRRLALNLVKCSAVMKANSMASMKVQ